MSNETKNLINEINDLLVVLPSHVSEYSQEFLVSNLARIAMAIAKVEAEDE